MLYIFGLVLLIAAIILGFHVLERNNFTAKGDLKRPSKFHEYFLSPFVGYNPFCYLIIDADDHIVHRRYGRDRTSRLPIADIAASFKPTGLFGFLLGYGNVMISNLGSNYEATRIMRTGELLEEIDRIKQPVDKQREFHIAQQCKKAIRYAVEEALAGVANVVAAILMVTMMLELFVREQSTRDDSVYRISVYPSCAPNEPRVGARRRARTTDKRLLD